MEMYLYYGAEIYIYKVDGPFKLGVIFFHLFQLQLRILAPWFQREEAFSLANMIPCVCPEAGVYVQYTLP